MASTIINNLRLLFFGLFILVSVDKLSAQESIQKIAKPSEVTLEVINHNSIPKEFEGLQWNRWVSKNFVVCSLNDTHAQYLHKNLEFVKNWTYVRWGLNDIDFSAECKVICVDNQILFKKLFNLDATKVEIRKDSSGKIKETVIFLLCNEPPSKILPQPITEVCLAQLSERNNLNYGLWSQRGMGVLNSNLDQIKQCIQELGIALQANESIFLTQSIFELDNIQYAKMTSQQQRIFDTNAAIVCLLLRKEFGQDKYLSVLQKTTQGNPEIGIKTVLGFDGYNHFDQSYKRYVVDLVRDISVGKTPNSYLQIREKN